MEPEDARLIRQYRHGNAKAFEELVRKYQRPLYTFLLRMVDDRQTAEDLFQEAFLRILRALPTYEERGKFSSWLFGIANNLAIDALRRDRRRNEHTVAYDDPLAQAISPDGNPEVDLENNELRRELSALLSDLPAKQKQVFLLRQHSGMTFKEIAEQMGEPLNTVLSHMNYAVKKLRQRFQVSGQ